MSNIEDQITQAEKDRKALAFAFSVLSMADEVAPRHLTEAGRIFSKHGLKTKKAIAAALLAQEGKNELGDRLGFIGGI